MNILVTDIYNAELSDALCNAVQAAGLTVTPVALNVHPNAIDQYRLGRVPCVARIYNGKAVYVTDDTKAVKDFDGVADGVVAAIEKLNAG
jgi:hypothetical protein